MKTTSFKKALLFLVNANKYLQENTAETKLKFALEKVGTELNGIGEKWGKKIEEIELDHAAEDVNGCVIYTERPNGSRKYSFTKDGMKKRDAAVEAAYEDESLVSFEPHIAASLPKDLHPALKEIFTDFVA